ncbi:MAG: hypothetical protein ACXVEE_40880 [Polyangiales bacterium]
MSFLRPIDCPRCGAPLPSAAIGASITECPYCDGTLVKDPRTVWASRYERAFAGADADSGVRVLGVPYALEERLGTGASTDVFAARRTRLPGERVVIKLLRAGASESALDHEVAVLSELAESHAPGTSHFLRRLPQLVARGVCDDGTPALVHRRLSGFDHTAEDVRKQHGDALDPRHAVWILRRVLELLGWLHASGFEHGDILPEHLVINARDHGVMLVGWSSARRTSAPQKDVAMATRAVAWLLGAARIPPGLASVIASHSTAPPDAQSAERDLVAASRVDFGPSRFVPLHLG